MSNPYGISPRKVAFLRNGRRSSSKSNRACALLKPLLFPPLPPPPPRFLSSTDTGRCNVYWNTAKRKEKPFIQRVFKDSCNIRGKPALWRAKTFSRPKTPNESPRPEDEKAGPNLASLWRPLPSPTLFPNCPAESLDDNTSRSFGQRETQARG